MEYKPLNASGNELRLIRILPADNIAALDLVSCLIEHVSLDDYAPGYARFLSELDQVPPRVSNVAWMKKRGQLGDSNTRSNPEHRWNWGEYIALSYVWGDEPPTRQLILNGHPTNIRPNLDDALRMLRKDMGTTDSPYIWVDALCINQNDVLERNVEVKRMSLIYLEALTVRSWLGNETGASADVFRFFRDCQVEVISVVEKRWISESSRGSSITTDLKMWIFSPEAQSFVRQLLDSERYGDSFWRGIFDLLNNPYWKRVWIVQELCLATASPLLCWGDQTCLFSDIRGALPLFNTTYMLEKLRLQTQIIIEDNSDLEWIGYIIPTLTHCVELARLQATRTKATDDRDRIFGILGMIDPAISCLIVPDYNTSKEEVYRNFNLAVIQATGKLNIIRQAGLPDPEGPNDTASWLADWSPDPIVEPSLQTFDDDGFQASGTSLHSLTLSRDTRQLHCTGSQIANIDGLGCEFEAPAHSIHQSNSPRTAYADKDAAISAIWETLMLGRMSEAQEHVVTYLRQIPWLEGKQLEATSAYYNQIAMFQQGNQDLQIAGRPFMDYFSPLPKDFEINMPNEEVQSAVHFMTGPMMWKRLMTTDTGFVGYTSLSSLPGDCIFILLGCDTPMVLRPNLDGGGYRVIGDCFIHGFMKGEGMEMLEQKAFILDDITLC